MKIDQSVKLPKYQNNLTLVKAEDGHDYVRSYETLVAKIDWKLQTLEVLGYWSATTSKHINYAATYCNLKIVK
jgi:hypothetical protein